MEQDLSPAPAGPGTEAPGGEGVGVPSVLFFALSSVGVLMVCAALVTTAFAQTGMTALPLAFLATGFVLALSVPGYVLMAKYTPAGGGIYTIISLGLGRAIGAALAWDLWLAYGLLQAALYGIFGYLMQGFVQAHTGLNWPWLAWALIGWLLVLVLGRTPVKIVGRVIAVLAIPEFAISMTLSVYGLLHRAPGQPLFHAFSFTGLGWAKAGPAMAIAALAYIGYETALAYFREAKRPRRTVTVATYICLGGSILIYTLAPWSIDAHYGAQTVSLAGSMGPEEFLSMANSMWSHLDVIANFLLLTSVLAAKVGYHKNWVNYAYTAARKGMLPGVFARVNSNRVASTASALQSACGFAMIAATQLFHLNPLTQTFFIGGTAGGYAILGLITVSMIAIVAFFLRTRHAESVWPSRILPGVAAVLLVAMMVLTTAHFALLIGVTPGDPVAAAIPVGFGVLFLCGLTWAVCVKKFARDRYDALIPATLPDQNTALQGASTREAV